MGEIFDFNILNDLAVNPTMGVLFFLAGFTATEKLRLHLCIKIFYKNKAYAVLIASAPIAALYIFLNNAPWETVLGTYVFVNAFYSHGLKKLKNYLP